MSTLQQLTPSQSSPDVPINENFAAIEHVACYAKRAPATAGLVWGYYGGRWGGFTVANGTFTLTASDDNYIVVELATGAVTCSNDDTNWNDDTGYARVYHLVTSSTAVTTEEDFRAGPGGIAGGSGGGGGAAASSVTVADVGSFFVGTNAETVLQELGASRAALGTASAKAADTDGTLAANSDANVATQKAVVTFVGARITAALASADVMEYKGAIDCSANPNYPAADAGAVYIVSVAGKIGGASGITVEVGDLAICKTDSTSSGDQATVGAQWDVIQTNIVNPALTTGTLAQFAATTSAQLASVLSDETGSGAAVFGTGPTLSSPVVGTQSPSDNSTKAASTAYVDAAVAAAGGGATGLAFTSSTTTTDSDPGTGTLRWNNATQASATSLYIDDADGTSTSLANLWAALPSGSLIKITKKTDPNTWQLWKMTSVSVDGTGYHKFAVTLLAQDGSSIGNGLAILLDIDSTTSGGQRVTYAIAASDPTTALSTGTNKGRYRVKEALTDLHVYADLNVAQASGSIFTVDVKKNGSSILSTKITIDNTEKTSSTAATAAVLSSTTIAADDEFTVDINQIGDGTAAGLIVTITGRRDDSAGGADGVDGVAGLNVLTTSGAPSSGTGRNGEFAYDPTARIMYGPKASGSWPGGVSLAALSRTVLASDVTNNNATANTIADVTGLSFAVVSGTTYRFRFVIQYTSAVTTTGSRWSINGPTVSALRYTSKYSLTTTTETTNHGLSAYDTPAASNASSAATGSNIAIIEGFITPSANGTVIARFASEVISSAIVAKAKSYVEFDTL